LSTDCIFICEMSSAILLLSVLIHLEFVPSGEPIRREQKKRVSLRPIIDFLHAPVFQLKADALSVTLRRIGCGLLVAEVIVTAWNDTQ
jgi:hypothetical protein